MGEPDGLREQMRALAEELDAISDEHYTAYKRGDPSDTRRGSPYTEGFCIGLDSAAQRIRHLANKETTP